MDVIKAKIDTINLNFKVVEDLSVISVKSKYEHIEIYPKLQEIFKVLGIPQDKFKLRNFSVASKYKLVFEGVFIEFKTMPPRAGEKIDYRSKICLVQLKGEWWLKNDFNKFIEIIRALKPDSISKLELAFDFAEDDVFLKDCMNLFLNFRSKITKLEGDNRVYFNFNHSKEFGISYSNISKEMKVYNKSEQLKGNKMQNIFYRLNPEFAGLTHYRVELGMSRSIFIDRNLNLKELLTKEISERKVIKKFITVFLTKFSIEKKSKLRNFLTMLDSGKYKTT